MIPCTAMFKGSWTVLLVFAPAGKQFTSSREQMQFITSCCFQTQPPSCSRGTRPFVHRSEIVEVSIHLNNMCPVYCVSFIHLFHPSLSSIVFVLPSHYYGIVSIHYILHKSAPSHCEFMCSVSQFVGNVCVFIVTARQIMILHNERMIKMYT
jgi:hypothetical protein